MTDLNKRIMVRVTERQEAWITEQAADEGMDNATFVRVLIDRLSKGRAPLIGMMQPQIQQLGDRAARVSQQIANETNLDEAADLIAQRAAEAEALIPESYEESEVEELPAAIPLTRIARPRFNPGRN